MNAEVAMIWREISAKAHVRGQAAVRKNVAPTVREPENNRGMKLVAELKPEVLSHYAMAGKLRIWLKKFEA